VLAEAGSSRAAEVTTQITPSRVRRGIEVGLRNCEKPRAVGKQRTISPWRPELG
jgi:hypothetical protein